MQAASLPHSCASYQVSPRPALAPALTHAPLPSMTAPFPRATAVGSATCASIPWFLQLTDLLLGPAAGWLAGNGNMHALCAVAALAIARVLGEAGVALPPHSTPKADMAPAAAALRNCERIVAAAAAGQGAALRKAGAELLRLASAAAPHLPSAAALWDTLSADGVAGHALLPVRVHRTLMNCRVPPEVEQGTNHLLAKCPAKAGSTQSTMLAEWRETLRRCAWGGAPLTPCLVALARYILTVIRPSAAQIRSPFLQRWQLLPELWQAAPSPDGGREVLQALLWDWATFNDDARIMQVEPVALAVGAASASSEAPAPGPRAGPDAATAILQCLADMVSQPGCFQGAEPAVVASGVASALGSCVSLRVLPGLQAWVPALEQAPEHAARLREALPDTLGGVVAAPVTRMKRTRDGEPVTPSSTPHSPGTPSSPDSELGPGSPHTTATPAADTVTSWGSSVLSTLQGAAVLSTGATHTSSEELVLPMATACSGHVLVEALTPALTSILEGGGDDAPATLPQRVRAVAEPLAEAVGPWVWDAVGVGALLASATTSSSTTLTALHTETLPKAALLLLALVDTLLHSKAGSSGAEGGGGGDTPPLAQTAAALLHAVDGLATLDQVMPHFQEAEEGEHTSNGGVVALLCLGAATIPAHRPAAPTMLALAAQGDLAEWLESAAGAADALDVVGELGGGTPRIAEWFTEVALPTLLPADLLTADPPSPLTCAVAGRGWWLTHVAMHTSAWRLPQPTHPSAPAPGKSTPLPLLALSLLHCPAALDTASLSAATNALVGALSPSSGHALGQLPGPAAFNLLLRWLLLLKGLGVPAEAWAGITQLAQGSEETPAAVAAASLSTMGLL